MNNDDRKVIAWARKPGKVSLMAALGGLAGMFGTPYYGTSRGRQPTRSQTRLGHHGDGHHTKKGPGRPTSYQANGYRKPGRAAAQKRLAKKTGKNRGVEGIGK